MLRARRSAVPAAPLLLALLFAACPEPAPETEGVPLGLDRTALFNYLATGDPEQTQPVGQLPADPFFAAWPLFPGPPGEAEEFLDLRLGLPTHGRWVTVRVDPATHGRLQAYLERVRGGDGSVPAPELPPGTTIVKVNYPNVNRAGVVERAAQPAVLTVLYKPGGDPCQTGVTYDGVHCLGDGWLWAFYGLDAPGLPREVFDKFVGGNPQAFCVNCHDPGFQTDYLRGLERLARVAAHEQRPTARPAQPPVIDDPDPLCEGPPVLSPQTPRDVAVDPASLPAEERQRLFDCFAWRSFVALNWPAGERRGQPDREAAFGDRPQAARVWETYKATWELFQPEDPAWDPTDPANPAGSFDSPRPLPAACGGSGADDLPLVHMIAKSNSRFSDVADVANEAGQAFAGTFGTLTDRNGELVRYQVLFNETEFDFLVPTAVTATLTPGGPDGGGGVVLPDGSVEVKTSWKQLCTDPGCQPVDDPGRYYHRDVYLYDADDGTCLRSTLGLTGLHLVSKTFWAPQWVWATFEHESNAPFAGSPPELEEDGWSFYDPARQPSPGEHFFADCSAQPFLASAKVGDPDCPNAELNRWPQVGFGDTPNQITRLDPVGGSGLNASFRAAVADTPWEHYLLVNTQWPLHGRRPAAPGEPLPVNLRLCPDQRDLSADPLRRRDRQRPSDCYTMVPPFLRNTSMESYMASYFERDDGEVVQVSNRSCMGCHAAGTDFSYVWIDAVEQIVPIAPGG